MLASRPVRGPYFDRFDLATSKEWSTHVPDIYSDELWTHGNSLEQNYPYENLPTALELVKDLVPVAEEQITKLPRAPLLWTQLPLSDKPALFQEYCPQAHDNEPLIDPWHWVRVDNPNFTHRAIN